MIKNLFDSILANLNSRIGGLIKDLTGLKSSLQFSQKDIEDLNPLTEQMTKIEKKIGGAQVQVDYHSDKMEYLENQIRRNNILRNLKAEILRNLKKTWEETESKAKVELESKLNLPFEVQIERAHRTGKAYRRQADASNASTERPLVFVLC